MKTFYSLMNKEIEMFTRDEELNKTRKIEFNKLVEKVEDEFNKLSYEEKVHQTDKNQEFVGVHLRMVSCKIVVVTLYFFFAILLH